MNITKCEAGHFYDSDSFERCPHCRRRETEAENEKKKRGTDKKKKASTSFPVDLSKEVCTGSATATVRKEPERANKENCVFECAPTELLYIPGLKNRVENESLPDFPQNTEISEVAEAVISEDCNTGENFTEECKTDEKIPEESKYKVNFPEENKTDKNIREDCKNKNNIPKESGTAENIPEGIKTGENITEDCKNGENIPENSKTYENIREGSKKDENITEGLFSSENDVRDNKATDTETADVSLHSEVESYPRRTENSETKTDTVVMNFDPVVGWLVGISGMNGGKSFSLYAGRNSVGNSKIFTVTLKEACIYPFDAMFFIVFDPESGEFILEPGQAREIVRLNGELLNKASVISENDVISAESGDYRLIRLCGNIFDFGEYGKLKI